MRFRIMRQHAGRALVLALAISALTGLPQAPAHAAYGPEIAVAITVKDGFGTTLATVDGWVRFDDALLPAAQYKLTLCRRSSYTSPFLGVSVTGATTTSTLFTSPYLGGYACETYGATAVVHDSNIRYMSFSISNASNFNGSQIIYYTGTRTYDNPFNPIN